MNTQEKIEKAKLSQESVSALIGRLIAHAEAHLDIRMLNIISELDRKVTELQIKSSYHVTNTASL